jgi:hypothetical protein
VQPKEEELASYLQRILLIIECSLMNGTLDFAAELIGVGRVDWCIEVLRTRKSLDEVFGINIHRLLEVYDATYSRPSTLIQATGATFAIDDLNLKVLKSVGKLSILWTTVFEDHLLLDLDDRVLSVAWFHRLFDDGGAYGPLSILVSPHWSTLLRCNYSKYVL